MQAHYICTGGCKGMSDTPGTCQAQDCPKYQMPLEECDCANGKHYGKLEDEGKEQN
ncbi:MAG: hypothetical protein HY001_03665 [Candidatus Portnoybacteria bacterium]|nr:hypothetical protein [Candidatus Portnoybacteria bacterium]